MFVIVQRRRSIGFKNYWRLVALDLPKLFSVRMHAYGLDEKRHRSFTEEPGLITIKIAARN